MEKSTAAFAEAYRSLNAKQKEAVDTIYGPVFVVAGPGTGKTQMLAIRIGNILLQSQGVKPSEVLALTFTEAGVTALRNRLATLLGVTAYRIPLYTFHGFARALMDMRPELFPRITDGTLLGDVHGITLMQSLLDTGAYPKLRNPKTPYRNVRMLLNFLKTLKQERFTPESYAEKVKEDVRVLEDDPDRLSTRGKTKGEEKKAFTTKRAKFEKYAEVAQLFAAYENALQARQLFDYEDLIQEAIRVLETDEGFRAEVGEQYQFVLADEHQDANPAQNKLLTLVSDFDGSPNLFVVGDEKQAIYRFQGASLDTFFSLHDTYPNAKIISLDKNYRSKSAILDSADALSSSLPIPNAAFRPKLEAVYGKGGAVVVAECPTPRAEYETIFNYLTELQKKGIPYSDIAILSRKNSDVLTLSTLLRARGIPEEHASVELNALENPSVHSFVALIRALSNLENDEALTRAIVMPGIPETLAKRRALLTKRTFGVPFLKTIENEGSTELVRWLKYMQRFSEEIADTLLVPFLTRLADDSGFLRGIFSLHENEDAYEAYKGLLDEAVTLAKEKRDATALDFISHLATIEEHDLTLKRPQTARGGVHLLTAHGAKGLEFPYVVITQATDRHWMRGRKPEFSLRKEESETAGEEDERRLFYVALTRAKEAVLITYAHVDDAGKEVTPLRFLLELAAERKSVSNSDNSTTETPLAAKSILDTAFLKERLQTVGFSPTSFNNFKKSPWQYYIRSLLLVPDVETRALLFGTAIHAGLYAFVKNGNDRAAAMHAFRVTIEQAALEIADRKSLLEHGLLLLENYLQKQGTGFEDVREAEYTISVPFEIAGVGTIPLKGKLDRIAVSPSGVVTVIDYKTGEPKSENEIRGRTKGSDGDYYRQLVFYKLLLQKQGVYTMDRAELHFLEPDAKGDVTVRPFVISDAEVAALENELRDAAIAIADGSAFQTICDPETCDYCDLVSLLTRD